MVQFAPLNPASQEPKKFVATDWTTTATAKQMRVVHNLYAKTANHALVTPGLRVPQDEAHAKVVAKPAAPVSGALAKAKSCPHPKCATTSTTTATGRSMILCSEPASRNVAPEQKHARPANGEDAPLANPKPSFVATKSTTTATDKPTKTVPQRAAKTANPEAATQAPQEPQTKEFASRASKHAQTKRGALAKAK